MKKILIFFLMLLILPLSHAEINATLFSYTEAPHTSVNLTPDFPAPGNDLVCEAFVWNNDSFNMSVHFSWYKNGILQDFNSTSTDVASNSTTTATLTATETSEGDNWTCKAYACFSEAGDVCGEEDNDSVVVGSWPTYLSNCQNITVQGEYILNTDILDYPGKVCFFINVSNVALDLNGHVVDGDGSISTNAIAAFKALPDPYGSPGYWSNITVVNGTITDWNSTGSPFGYTSGLLLGNASNITVEGIQISNSGFPLLFNPQYGSRIENLVARNIEINYSATPTFNFIDKAEIENFYVHDSSGDSYNTIDGGYGMQILGGNNITVANYSVRNATWSSFYVTGNSSNISFENVSSELAGWGAFTISNSYNITIKNASVEKTRALWFHPFSQHALLFENGNGFYAEKIFVQNNSNMNGLTVLNAQNIFLNDIFVDRKNRTVNSGINATNVYNLSVNNTRVLNIYNSAPEKGMGLYIRNSTLSFINNSYFENITCGYVIRFQDCGIALRGYMDGYYEAENIYVKSSTSVILSEFSSPVMARVNNITVDDMQKQISIIGLNNSNISNIFIYNYSRINEWMWAMSLGAENTNVENITGENIRHGGILVSISKNVSVKNVIMNNFTQSSPYYNRASAFQFYYSYNCSLSNVLLTNITPSNWYAGGVGVFGSTNATITNVTCYGCGNGFVVGVTLPSSDITLRDSNFYNSSYKGVALWGVSGAYWSHNIHIFNVSVFNSSANSLYIAYANNTLVENSTFDERTGVISYVRQANNLTIRNNIFKNGSFRVEDAVYDKTLIYNNIFNRSATYDSGSNYWNTTYDCSQRSIIDGDCMGGNWYSDYCGGDDGSGLPPIHNIAGDEIGDSYAPYSIEGGTAQDELPLTWNNESTCGKISECTTLRVSNMEYTLVNNIYGWKEDFACITIKAQNITLDCSGYNITGDINNSQAQYGILSRYSGMAYSNTSFINCGINQYNFGVSISGGSVTENVVVSNISVDQSNNGIYISRVRNVEIKNNVISNSTPLYNGIYVSGDYNQLTPDNLTIVNNTVIGASNGIQVESADYIDVRNNNVSGGMIGLQISSSTKGTFDSNIISNNTWNLYIGKPWPPNPVYYRHNLTTSNLVGFGSDLKPVYYYMENKTGDGISANPPENAGFVGFVDSSGFEVKNLNMSNNSNAVVVVNSTDINFSNITSYYQALDGMYVASSQNIRADGFYVSAGSETGLYITNSSHSSFTNFDLISNRQAGVISEGISNTTFENISVSNSEGGFVITGVMSWPPTKAEGNSIKNIYIDNTSVAFYLTLLANTSGENVTIRNATNVAIYSSNTGSPNENVSLNEVRIYQGSTSYFTWINTYLNVLNITNVSFLANDAAGVIFFPDLNLNNSTSTINNLRVDEWFASLNSSPISEYNRSANITIRTNTCGNVKVYALDGFPLSRDEIIGSGEIYPSAKINNCTSNIVGFEVEGFTGYAASGTPRGPSGGGGGGKEERNITVIIPQVEEDKSLKTCPTETGAVPSGGELCKYNVYKYYKNTTGGTTVYMLFENVNDDCDLGSFSISYIDAKFDYSSLASREFLLIPIKIPPSIDPCAPVSVTSFAVPREIIIEAPLEVPVGTNVTVNVSYVNKTPADNINIVVLTPLNKNVYYLTNGEGEFSYVASNEGPHIYSAPGYVIRKSVITYAYLTEAKSLIIPLYITEPTRMSINTYSMGVSIGSLIKIKDPYNSELEAEAPGGRYEHYITVPGRYTITIIPLEEVPSLSASIELEKAPFVLPLLDKPELWAALLLVILLLLAVDYYRTKMAVSEKRYTLVQLTKPARTGKTVDVRIVDKNKNPVRGAKVKIYIEEGGVLVAEQKTDANGIVSFVPNREGKYLFECEKAELKKNEITVQ